MVCRQMSNNRLPGAGEPRFAASADFWGVNTSARAESVLCPGAQGQGRPGEVGRARWGYVPWEMLSHLCRLAGGVWEEGEVAGDPLAPFHISWADAPLKTESK